MKRMWIIVILAVISMVSCIKEQGSIYDTLHADEEEGKVTIPFEVMSSQISTPATKTIILGEDTPLETLHLAVFGGNGYLKEYVKAQNLERISDTTYIGIDGNSRTAARYKFTATLSLTENKRTIHFIGNGPSTLTFGYAEAVIPALLSDVGGRSYWQMDSITGIRAKKSDKTYIDKNNIEVEPGDFIDKDSCKIINNRGYIPDAATLNAFKSIPLVRNWSKIVIASDSTSSYFNPYSYAVVNVPSRGSIAPHCANTGFVRNYQSYKFQDLIDMNYTANLNQETRFDTDIPTEEDFMNYTGGVTKAEAGNGVYIYERPVPASTTTFPASSIIVYGYYSNPKDLEHNGFYYYKVDLMEGDTYYPVFRNFQYEIIIEKILSQGHHTPAAAAAAAGSANVSADINAKHLADISDGIARLIIDPWMSHTYTEKVTDGKLQCFYVDSVATWRVNLDSDAVSVKKLDMPLGEPDVIDTVWIDDPITDIEGSIGWRTIHFTTNDQGTTQHSQTIRVTAKHELSTLYRDIVITLLPKQKMIIRCPRNGVAPIKKTEFTMEIVIPDGLAESMFPLNFWIEPERMTLTPDNNKSSTNNLPVSPGNSISSNPQYADKPSFHYTRSLSWQEYRTLSMERDEDGNRWRILPCYFLTNCDDNATTIWVQNDYFITSKATFSNEQEWTFRNLGFTSPIPIGSGHRLPVHFDIDKDPDLDDYPSITLICSGLYLIMDGSSHEISQVIEGVYNLKPSTSSVDLEFISTVDDGDLRIELAAENYLPKSLRTHRFTDFGFKDGHKLFSTTYANYWSNVVCGHINSASGKTVLFGYCDDEESPNTPISLSVKDNGLVLQTPKSFPWTPDGPRSSVGDPLYHEIEYKTPSTFSTAPIEVTLSANGYVDETFVVKRFWGDIYTYDKITTSTVFKSNNTYNFTVANPTFTIKQNAGGTDNYVTFTFDKITNAYKTGSNPDGMLLGAGDTYTLTVTSTPAALKLFYVQFTVSNTQWNGVTEHLGPKSWRAINGTLYKYKGANDQYIWELPAGTNTATLELTADDNYPINIKDIIFKTYKATLYE